MLRLLIKKPLLALCIGCLLACEPEQQTENSPILKSPPEAVMGEKLSAARLKSSTSGPLGEYQTHSNNMLAVALAVEPTECGATDFNRVLGKHFEELLRNPEVLEHLDHYAYLNRQAARLGIESHYFGRNGARTKLVQKVEKDLKRFWSINREIRVLGQHNNTLKNREYLADIYWYSLQDMVSKEEAYEKADEILKLNRKYPVLLKTPLIASDGFSAQHGIIVIGDGLIQMFTETGVDDQIVWTGILTHEWAHQVQFHFFDSWEADYPSDTSAEFTRARELEADFFAGYYMTHKRGATYNWKRAEEFFELFYQSGDCTFEFEQHHGTPLQRKRATYQGYLLAESAQKKGKILSAEELHEIFMDQVLPETVNGSQYL